MEGVIPRSENFFLISNISQLLEFPYYKDTFIYFNTKLEYLNLPSPGLLSDRSPGGDENKDDKKDDKDDKEEKGPEDDQQGLPDGNIVAPGKAHGLQSERPDTGKKRAGEGDHIEDPCRRGEEDDPERGHITLPSLPEKEKDQMVEPCCDKGADSPQGKGKKEEKRKHGRSEGTLLCPSQGTHGGDKGGHGTGEGRLPEEIGDGTD